MPSKDKKPNPINTHEGNVLEGMPPKERPPKSQRIDFGGHPKARPPKSSLPSKPPGTEPKPQEKAKDSPSV